MDIENIEYLNNISRRVEYYFTIRKKAITYISKNRITDKDLMLNIMLMSAVWAASQRNENLTEEELVYLFGLVSKEEFTTNTLLSLHPAQSELTLEELLEITVETYNPK
jgi:hypothetical protein